jgi:epsilon-lactone hydrolase
MASWQSRVARGLVRYFVRRPLTKHQKDLADQCGAIRRSLELGDPLDAMIPRDISIVPSTSGGVRGEWVMRKDVTFGDKAVLYIHGGGMVAGTTRGYRGKITIPLARKLGVPVFAVEYRRAPEHRFPVQLDDCIAAYRVMREQIPAEGIIFAGDSAGGNLVLATLLALRERDHVARPCAGIIGLSPWTDLASTGASVTENAQSDDMFPPPTPETFVGLAYADPSSFTDPLVSPLYGEYAGAPPILLFASTIEMLRDDSTRLAEKLKHSGVDTTLVLAADMPHVWPVFPTIPEAGAALDTMFSFAVRSWLQAKVARADALTI